MEQRFWNFRKRGQPRVFPLRFMTRALHAWVINQWGKNSVRNLQYSPRTRLVRCMYAKIHNLKVKNVMLRYGQGYEPISSYGTCPVTLRMTLRASRRILTDVIPERFLRNYWFIHLIWWYWGAKKYCLCFPLYPFSCNSWLLWDKVIDY